MPLLPLCDALESQQKLMYQSEGLNTVLHSPRFFSLWWPSCEGIAECRHTRTHTLSHNFTSSKTPPSPSQIDILFIHFSCWTLFVIDDYFPFKLIRNVSFFYCAHFQDTQRERENHGNGSGWQIYYVVLHLNDNDSQEYNQASYARIPPLHIYFYTTLCVFEYIWNENETENGDNRFKTYKNALKWKSHDFGRTK